MIIVITGASSGFGRLTADALASALTARRSISPTDRPVSSGLGGPGLWSGAAVSSDPRADQVGAVTGLVRAGSVL